MDRRLDAIALPDSSPMNWRTVFGENYRDVERHTIYTRALATTNVRAWVNAMDVFNDWMLVALTPMIRHLEPTSTAALARL